ncbi:unnamed protein product [Ambrosiozyma monospora]|uniref:Unnamed protein product n=1 Tax=Ambrosiozyma monospora TaxID=43982 RepID=A0ACB5T7D3_AMBMO|nr:unnamed protein product [Ambrosiozyma monospora]
MDSQSSKLINFLSKAECQLVLHKLLQSHPELEAEVLTECAQIAIKQTQLPNLFINSPHLINIEAFETTRDEISLKIATGVPSSALEIIAGVTSQVTEMLDNDTSNFKGPNGSLIFQDDNIPICLDLFDECIVDVVNAIVEQELNVEDIDDVRTTGVRSLVQHTIESLNYLELKLDGWQVPFEDGQKAVNQLYNALCDPVVDDGDVDIDVDSEAEENLETGNDNTDDDDAVVTVDQ